MLRRRALFHKKGFNPIIEVNNILYTDPTDETTINRSGPDLVSISDAFGGAYTALAEGGIDIVSGEIVYDGVDDDLNYTDVIDLNQTSHSYFILFNTTSHRDFNALLSKRSGSGHGYRIQGKSDGTFNGNLYNGAYLEGTNLAVAANQYYVIGVKFVNNGSVWEIHTRLNKNSWSIATGVDNNTVLNAVNLKSGRYDPGDEDRWFVGKCKGLMCYNEDVVTAKADIITDFLTAKI